MKLGADMNLSPRWVSFLAADHEIRKSRALPTLW
jgi:hypothetical protein